jgi:hypothetical protein
MAGGILHFSRQRDAPPVSSAHINHREAQHALFGISLLCRHRWLQCRLTIG